MRIDPHLARDAMPLVAALRLFSAARPQGTVHAWSLSVTVAPPPAPGPAPVVVPPELLELDFTATLPADRGLDTYARAAAARIHYEGPVRPVDLRA